jgi:DNA polymerase-4
VDRSILHVEVPAFPIAVERVIDPGLRGRPVAVAPPGAARATVLSASLEAAAVGIRVGMPVRAAVRRCPGIVLLPANEYLYRRAAAAVLALLGAYSPRIEPETHGRSYLDLTGTGRLLGNATDVAARIRREVVDRLRLPATVGVATNKLVSRVAARVIHPGGLCDVFPGGEALFLAPLPVGFLPAAAIATSRARCEDLGISRVGDLLDLSPPQLRIAFGPYGVRLHRQACGIDDSPVRPPEVSRAVVEEETLAEDTNARAVLLRALLIVCERAGVRLRRLRAAPRRLRVTLHHTDSVMVYRETLLPAPAAADLLLFSGARHLLDRMLSRRVRVRRVTLRCFDFVRGPRQLPLFEPPELRVAGPVGPADGDRGNAPPHRIGAAETLAEAVDRIRERFGVEAIVWGRTLPERRGTPMPGRACP